ncbi:MAG: histidinol dehydrogenase [Candidatus Hydrogenedentes bacterium]|nr:histidinol dehydrogenase [Candidatus Hydrogenedentota bacterium]MBI3118308.1 histidinol dehydrogenase [Candidatus Hydrogenedentota bacterium]
MIKVVSTITGDASRALVEAAIINRGADTGADKGLQEKIEATRWIVEAVRKNGDAALAEFTERFDGVQLTPEQFELGAEEIDQAVSRVDPQLLNILRRAHDNIRRFHAKHLRESWEETFEDGTVLGQRVSPIESAGVYVPGGKAYYPSSVLMNIVPARVAGVKDIVMVSPPSFQGSIHPVVLAAARLAGATRVFRVGGAQAIAALAYGTETVPPVTKITGPGNTFVTAAKALVRSRVDIDSEAGPSEVVVLADAAANPAYVAAELLAQAEHDEEAMCVLITPSAPLVEQVQRRLADEVRQLPRAAIIVRSLEDQGRIIITRDMPEAIALTNLIAPEHLSVQVEYPRRVAEKIENAGAMMLGDMTPVAVGDYFAGPNHILPTGRRARFSSPLTTEDFRKVTSILYYTRDRLKQESEDISAFAQAEQLQAHARSIEVRQ